MTPSPQPAPKVPDRPETTDPLQDKRFRNLLLGSGASIVALVVLAAAIALAGPVPGLIGLGTALLAMSIGWLCWRMKLLDQPGGLFPAAAATLCGALLLPLVVGIAMQANNIEFKRPMPQAVEPVPPARTMPTVETTPGLPLLSDAFPVIRPDIEKDTYVEVSKDSKIKIDDQFYRINAGETFVFRRTDGDEVIFRVKDFLVSLPASAVKVHRPGPEVAADSGVEPPVPKATASAPDQSPLEATRAAQAEAIRRYPALSVQDSRENKTYVEAYMKLKESNPDFFNDPEWPLQLAEGVAEREGWKREDQ